MIIFEQTLRDLLIQTNLVGTRVFLMRAPQVPTPAPQVPYVVFFMVGPLPMMTMTSPSNHIQRDYQISIFDNSQSRALAIADSFRTFLDGFSGDYENTHIGHAFYMTQTWAWEPDTMLFQVIQEYRIAFNYLNT